MPVSRQLQTVAAANGWASAMSSWKGRRSSMAGPLPLTPEEGSPSCEGSGGGVSPSGISAATDADAAATATGGASGSHAPSEVSRVQGTNHISIKGLYTLGWRRVVRRT